MADKRSQFDLTVAKAALFPFDIIVSVLAIGKIGSIKSELLKFAKKNKRLVALAIALLLITIGFCAWWLLDKQQSESNTTNGLSAAIITDDPTHPALRLTNATESACQVVKSARGTVAITEVRQKGKIIEPRLVDASSDESLGDSLSRHWQTLQPGGKVDIALRSVDLKDRTFLESYTWSPDGGAFVLVYTLSSKDPFEITANYTLPLAPAEGAPACSGIAVTAKVGTGLANYGFIAVAIIITLPTVILLVRRKPRGAGAALFILGIGGTLWLAAPPVSAEFRGPGASSTQFAVCMDIFSQHSDITDETISFFEGPDAPDVIIIPNTEIINNAADYRGVEGFDGIKVDWDYTSSWSYRPDNLPADYCSVLFHELTHAINIHRGINDRRECGDSGIPIAEVLATRAENRLRAARGLQKRAYYDGKPLPKVGVDCFEQADQPQPKACGNNCGTSSGDPHLYTFDGLSYDFMAVGEFILARDPAGDFEVQTRQAPWGNSRQVSINSAVAMRVGQDKLELRLGEDTVKYYLNGEETKQEDIELKSGSITTSDDRYVQITWDDGSTVVLRPLSNFSIEVAVGPAPERKGKLQGALGNFDGNKNNDLRLQDSDEVVKPEFDELYPKFADSWRAEQDESLFTYKNGEDTNTFTDRGFPDGEATIDDVPNRAAVEEFCRQMGVIDKTVLQNCILDVGLTGRPEFALSAADSQNNSQSIDYGGQHWDVKIDKPHDVVKLPFEGKAGQKVFVEFTEATFSLGGSPTKITDEGGSAISHGSWIVGGEGYIKATKLPKDGKYNIEIDSYETGSVHVQLITTQDQSHSITPDGPMTTTRLSVPGSVADFTFDGKKGEKIFVDIPFSDFSGKFLLIDPDGREQHQGNILLDESLDRNPTITLQKSGTYTVKLDPQKSEVGEAGLRVVRSETVQAAIQVGGPPVTAKLDKPGSTARLSFDGSSGQKVLVDFTDATFPGLCSNAWLISPSGESIDSACIVFGGGSFNKILPESGRYQIIIDPRGRATGEITVSVRPG